MYERVTAQIRRRAMGYPLSALTMRSSAFGREAGAVGASVLVLKHAATFLFSS
jgi:hypothetical protein